MSDTPNFDKIRLSHRNRIIRLVIVAVVLAAGALVWSFADEPPSDVEVEMQYPAGTQAMIGQDFQYGILIKNDGAVTTEVVVQTAFINKSGECGNPGATLTGSFSLPQTFSIPPNGNKSINTSFNVTASCEMSEVVPRIFVTFNRDGSRSSKTFEARPIHVL